MIPANNEIAIQTFETFRERKGQTINRRIAIELELAIAVIETGVGRLSKKTRIKEIKKGRENKWRKRN